jgi:hypothetical protein
LPKVPDAVGVPLNTPLLFKVIPPGNDPAVFVHVV